MIFNKADRHLMEVSEDEVLDPFADPAAVETSRKMPGWGEDDGGWGEEEESEESTAKTKLDHALKFLDSESREHVLRTILCLRDMGAEIGPDDPEWILLLVSGLAANQIENLPAHCDKFVRQVESRIKGMAQEYAKRELSEKGECVRNILESLLKEEMSAWEKKINDSHEYLKFIRREEQESIRKEVRDVSETAESAILDLQNVYREEIEFRMWPVISTTAMITFLFTFVGTLFVAYVYHDFLEAVLAIF